MVFSPRFDSPGDAGYPERLRRLGRYGKAAGFLLIFPAALLMLGLRYGACELVAYSQPQTYAATGPRRY